MPFLSKITLNGVTYDLKSAGSEAPVTGVKGNAENVYRQGNVNITPTDIGAVSVDDDQSLSDTQKQTAKNNIGLDKVPNVTTNNQTPTFSKASSRTNIASGDKLSVIMGKIMKFFSDLKTVAFSGSYEDLSDKPTIPTIPGVVSTSANGLAPKVTDTSKFLKGDGTWDKDIDYRAWILTFGTKYGRGSIADALSIDLSNVAGDNNRVGYCYTGYTASLPSDCKLGFREVLYYNSSAVFVKITGMDTNNKNAEWMNHYNGTTWLGWQKLTILSDSVPPKSHASTATTYGVGTTSKYGHLKISDSYTSSAGAASAGVAASSKAVSDTYNTLNNKMLSVDSTFDGVRALNMDNLGDLYFQFSTSGNTKDSYIIYFKISQSKIQVYQWSTTASNWELRFEK